MSQLLRRAIWENPFNEAGGNPLFQLDEDFASVSFCTRAGSSILLSMKLSLHSYFGRSPGVCLASNICFSFSDE
jgi:hypothetical protein